MIDLTRLQVKLKRDFLMLLCPYSCIICNYRDITYLSDIIKKLNVGARALLLFYSQKWFSYEQANWHTNNHNYDHL